MSKGPHPPPPVDRPPVPDLPPMDPSPSDPCAEPFEVPIIAAGQTEVGGQVVIAPKGTGHVALSQTGEVGPIPHQFEARLRHCELAGWRFSGQVDKTDSGTTTIRIWGAREFP